MTHNKIVSIKESNVKKIPIKKIPASDIRVARDALAEDIVIAEIAITDGTIKTDEGISRQVSKLRSDIDSLHNIDTFLKEVG